MILGQLLANPGSGGEQDLAPLSLHSPGQWGRTVWNLEVAARQSRWAGCSPLRQPTGLWRADRGGKALGAPSLGEWRRRHFGLNLRKSSNCDVGLLKLVEF